MADKRTIKFEISVDADTKGVERFGRVLNDLQKAAPIADSELRKVRQAVLEFSQQSGTSATSLKALEAALTKLQSEAATGGSTWKLLGKDIAGVKQKIGELSGTIRSAEQAQKDLNRALNAPIGNTFGKIADQTATLKRELAGLKFRTDQYLQTLTRVREIETVGSFNQGRLNTIAANQAFMGATLSRGYGASQNLPTLPNTLAGDSQRVSELTERIRNLDRGSELYLQTVKELASANAQAARAQEQLNKALNDSPIAVARQRLENQRQQTSAIRQDAIDYRQNRAVRRSIERNQDKRAREAERLRFAAAEAFPSTLALPGAGESSFWVTRTIAERQRAIEDQRRRDLAEQGRQRRAAKLDQMPSTDKTPAAFTGLGARIATGGPERESIRVARERLEVQRQATKEAQQSYTWEWLSNREAKARVGEEKRIAEQIAASNEYKRRQAAEAFPPPQIRSLPAAGQTTFQGSIDSRGFGGGARGRITGGETPLIISTDRPGRAAFRGGNDYAGPGFGINTNAVNASTQAANQQRGALAELFLAVDRVTQSSNGSIASLQRQRAAWEELRNAVNPLAPAYTKAGAAIDRLDEQIKTANQTPAGIAAQNAEARRKRLRAAGEIATAIGVAGYFGGPEAVVGAAVGSAFGPGGAQIGTTVGLAAGGLRQQIGNTADQAAQLNKLQVSLRSIAGSEAEYTRALRAINTANRELNIPLLEGTRAMTQLTAAVKGAGGTVADAELAYQGITAAIKATGGSSADAEGAIRALVQTFSKGKVSAEEIRQQLAERLPGAVTLFAQATGRTGAELDKAFEQGEVGLNDLMKFLGELNTRYSETARRLAASNDEAGLRLQLRWEQTTLAIGKAFQPLGAEIQNSLVKIIEDNDDAVIKFINTFTRLTTTLSENNTAIEITKMSIEMTKFLAVAAGIRIIGNLLGALGAAAIGTSATITTTGGAAVVAASKLDKLRIAVAGLVGSWVPTLVLTVSVIGAFKAIEEINRLRKTIDFDPERYKQSAKTKPTNEIVKERLNLAAQLKNVEKEIAKAQQAVALDARIPKTGDLQDIQMRANNRGNLQEFQKRASNIRKQMDALDKEIASRREKEKPKPTNFDDPAAESDKSKQDAAAKRQQQIAEQLAAERQRMLEAETQQEIRLADEVYRHKIELENRRHERAKELADLRARAELAQMSPNQRGIAELLRGIDQSRTDYDNRIREAQQRSEEAQRQVQNASRMAAVTGAGLGTTQTNSAITFGNTGRVKNAPGWVHGHFQTNTGTLAQLVADTAPVVMALIRSGVPAELANGARFRSGMSAEEIKRMLYQGAKLHGHSGDGRSIDVFVPKGTKVPVPLTDVRNTGGNGGVTGVLPGSGHSWLGHLPLQAASGQGPRRTPTGVAAQGRRNVADTGDVGVAITAAEAANANLNDLKGGRAAFLQASANAQIAEYVRNTRDSTAALREETQQLKDRNRYTLEGYRPEVVEEMVKRLAAERRYNEQRRALDAELVKAENSGDIDRIATTTEAINELTSAYQNNIQAIRDQTQAQLDARAAAENSFDLRLGARRYVESIGTMRDASATLTQTGIKGIEDALVSLATTGTANFQAFAVSILQETARMIIQQLILKTIMQAIGFLGGGSSGGGFSFGGSSGGFNLPGFQMPSYMQAGNAFGFGNGGAFTEQGVQLFAKGGIVDKPTFFKFANGGSLANGILGEAGPEAIMPLKRGADGKLGVVSAGGAPVSVTVNVDASGTSAQGNSDQSKQLGRAVAAAVQAELIKQKRPGGLLVT